MKAELQGAIIVSLTMAEARALMRSLSSTALNSKEERDKATVDLYRALFELVEGRAP